MRGRVFRFWEWRRSRKAPGDTGAETDRVAEAEGDEAGAVRAETVGASAGAAGAAGAEGARAEAAGAEAAGLDVVEPEAPSPGTCAAVRHALRYSELRFLTFSTRTNIRNALASNPGEQLTDRTHAKILIALFSDRSRAMNERGQQLIQRARLATLIALDDNEGTPSARAALLHAFAAAEANATRVEAAASADANAEASATAARAAEAAATSAAEDAATASTSAEASAEAANSAQTQPDAAGSDGKGNVAMHQEEADEEDVYATEDGRLEVSFLYHQNGDEGWRIYILNDPDYGVQETGAHETHRYYNYELALHYICYDLPIRTKEEAKRVSADWADLTSNYILTGQQF